MCTFKPITIFQILNCINKTEKNTLLTVNLPIPNQFFLNLILPNVHYFVKSQILLSNKEWSEMRNKYCYGTKLQIEY